MHTWSEAPLRTRLVDVWHDTETMRLRQWSTTLTRKNLAALISLCPLKGFRKIERISDRVYGCDWNKVKAVVGVVNRRWIIQFLQNCWNPWNREYGTSVIMSRVRHMEMLMYRHALNQQIFMDLQSFSLTLTIALSSSYSRFKREQ